MRSAICPASANKIVFLCWVGNDRLKGQPDENMVGIWIHKWRRVKFLHTLTHMIDQARVSSGASAGPVAQINASGRTLRNVRRLEMLSLAVHRVPI